MRCIKHVWTWILLFLLAAAAFTFTDNFALAADNSTNSSNQALIETFLQVWDNNYVYEGSPATVYANYSYENSTIAGVEVCWFNEDLMNFNMSSGLYYFSKIYEHPGNYSYEVFCSKEGFMNKSESGILEVLLSNMTQNQTNETNITDLDSDGYDEHVDCDDTNPDINPGMPEMMYNSIDDDCNPHTLDYVVFDISTARSNYAHQEVVSIYIEALNTSDTYITINTPTNVSYVYIFANGSYPAEQQFSLTGMTGTYTIEGVNYFGNYTNTKEVNFSVSNSMQVEIVADKSAADANETINFRADITGSIGEPELIWNMDDGNEVYDQEFSYSYSLGRTYNIVLIVTDDGGNYVVKTKQVKVNPIYKLKVKVIENSTNSVISNATVELDNDDVQVNSSGIALYNVTNRTYNLEVFAPGYYAFDEDIRINKSYDFTVKLVKDEGQAAPVVTLVSPGNNTKSVNSEFKFRFTDNTNATCTLLVSEGDGWWLDVNSSEAMRPGADYTFRPDLGPGEYSWKVQCIDKDDNMGISPGYLFTLEASETVGIQENPETTYNVIQNVYDVIPDFSSYSPDEQKIAAYLKMDALIREATRKLEIANRDLYNLNSEPNTESILAKRDNIYADIETIKDQTPLSVNVMDKADFVKYPTEEELEQLFEEYISLKNIELSNKERRQLLEKNNLLQKKATVRTTAYKVEITYISDRKEQVTLIARTIETDESAKDIMYVEFIPKEIIDSTDSIEFVTQPDSILNKDPVFEIQMNKVKEFVYYTDKVIPLDTIPKIDIAVLSTIVTEQDSAITGFAVFDTLGFSQSKAKIFMIQVVVVFILLGIYLFFYFRSGSSVALPKLSLRKKKPIPVKQQIIPAANPTAALKVRQTHSPDEHHKITYMNQVISKTYSLLDTDLEKAALNYHELKFLYELMPQLDRDIVHEDVISLADEINYRHVQKLVDDAVIELAHNNKQAAHEIYDHIQEEFDKLPEKFQKTVYKKCCEIALHLK